MSQISKKKFWKILTQKSPAKIVPSCVSDKDTPQSVWLAGYTRWRKLMDKVNAND
jgi:hypothetical protein